VKLAQETRKILKQIKNGADIWGLREARILRECEKDGLVEICESQADIPGEQRQPYFGCILTAKGREVI